VIHNGGMGGNLLPVIGRKADLECGDLPRILLVGSRATTAN
jgi:hypothetical protein